jgi:hypothetical protein
VIQKSIAPWLATSAAVAFQRIAAIKRREPAEGRRA